MVPASSQFSHDPRGEDRKQDAYATSDQAVHYSAVDVRQTVVAAGVAIG
jgi:hypothetical protein